MPVVRCSYCGKPFKVSASRERKINDGVIRNPSCSRRCQGKVRTMVSETGGSKITEPISKRLFQI